MESVHKKYHDTSKNLSSFRTEKLSLERNSQFCELTDLDGYSRDFSDQHLLVELFSGAGGLSLGLEIAGFRYVIAVDKLQDSVETHACHFPGASINCDISDEKTLEELVEPLRNQQISLLAGGPPCQPFQTSEMGKEKGEMELGSMKDHRRELWQSLFTE